MFGLGKDKIECPAELGLGGKLWACRLQPCPTLLSVPR